MHDLGFRVLVRHDLRCSAIDLPALCTASPSAPAAPVCQLLRRSASCPARPGIQGSVTPPLRHPPQGHRRQCPVSSGAVKRAEACGRPHQRRIAQPHRTLLTRHIAYLAALGAGGAPNPQRRSWKVAVGEVWRQTPHTSIAAGIMTIKTVAVQLPPITRLINLIGG